jgi:hypothetical protein
MIKQIRYLISSKRLDLNKLKHDWILVVIPESLAVVGESDVKR